MQAAIIFKENSKVYLETFLIDNTVTKKGKKVNSDSIDSNVLASSKHPLTLYTRQKDGTWIWDHPILETNSLSQNIEFQRKYEIGHAVRLKKVKDGYWNAVYEITDEGAKNLFTKYLGKTIPFYTSSGIIHSSSEDPQDIKEWRIIHNAIVSEPANGFEKAQIVDMCSGTEQSCSAILTASLSKDFCTATCLENYISSLASATQNFPHYTMSSESAGAVSYGITNGTNTVANPINQQPVNPQPVNTNTNTNTNTENPVPKTETKEKKEEIDYKAKVKELEEQLNLTKKEKEAKELEHKTVSDRVLSLERENIRNTRKNQILSLVQQYPEAFLDAKTGLPNNELYSKTILEWVDKNYDDATVIELLEAKQTKWVNAVQNPKECLTCNSSTATSDYQSTTMTTASVSSDSSLPIWEKISDITNARIRLFADKYQKTGGQY